MKYIKMPKANEEDIIKEFKKYIAEHKTNTGKISFSYDYAKPEFKGKKPTVIFTAIAWLKMTSLVDNCSTEIGWHGLVEKRKGIYYITDILVYPQTVTGATVDADDEEYPKWLMSIPDNDFSKLKMQGHSHVNFGVTPSATDNNFYNKLLQNMEQDAFYIFMIINKKKDLNIWIYDFKANIIFEKKDITVDVSIDSGFLNKWYDKTYESNVKQYTVTKGWNIGGASKNIVPADEYEYDYNAGIYRRRYL